MGSRNVSAALQDGYWPPEQVDPRTTPQAAQQTLDAAIR
jgi:hypothetical protein